MDKKTLQALMHKLLLGKATPEEMERMEAWWQQAEDDESYLNSLPEAEREQLRLTMLGNIREHLHSMPVAAPAPGRSKNIVLKSVYWRVAAAVLLCIVACTALYLFTRQKSYITHSTEYGQRQQLLLPDSSVVVLNGNSAIRYATRWPEGAAREVWLEGEGFFSVTHTRNHRKFKVYTPGEVDVEVLGTEFNVRYRRDTTQVVLQTGKVKVSRQSQQYTMRPGQMLVASPGKAAFRATLVDPAVHLSWKGQMLVFREATLQSVARQLEDSYGIRVKFQGEGLSQEVFNGSIPTDSAHVFFRKIEKLYGVKVTRQQEVYLVEK
jgi:ferric-dicitrate binding protein FerR (iron transport regulator)